MVERRRETGSLSKENEVRGRSKGGSVHAPTAIVGIAGYLTQDASGFGWLRVRFHRYVRRMLPKLREILDY